MAEEQQNPAEQANKTPEQQEQAQQARQQPQRPVNLASEPAPNPQPQASQVPQGVLAENEQNKENLVPVEAMENQQEASPAQNEMPKEEVKAETASEAPVAGQPQSAGPANIAAPNSSETMNELEKGLEKKESVEANMANQPEKKGLFAKIMSLFGRK